MSKKISKKQRKQKKEAHKELQRDNLNQPNGKRYSLGEEMPRRILVPVQAVKTLCWRVLRQLSGRKNMENDYGIIILRLEEARRELRLIQVSEAPNVLQKRIEEIVDYIESSPKVDPKYDRAFYDVCERWRSGYQSTANKQSYHDDLFQRLIYLTRTWQSQPPTHTYSDTSKLVAFGKIDNLFAQSGQAPSQASNIANSALANELKIKLDQMQLQLTNKDAELQTTTAQYECSKQELEKITQEYRYYKGLYEIANADLDVERQRLIVLQNSAIPKDWIQLIRRLAEKHDSLSSDLQELLAGITRLHNDLSIRPNRQWYEQNLDRIRAYVYERVEPLTVLTKRALSSSCFDDYYCLLLAQYEMHKLLESNGLTVICPAKGDVFKKDHHDFSDRDLVWIDDQSRDNQIESVRRVGFLFRETTGKVSVLRKALVRRCVFSSESLQAESAKTIPEVEIIQNDVAGSASNEELPTSVDAENPSEQAHSSDILQAYEAPTEEESSISTDEVCLPEADAPDTTKSVYDEQLDDVFSNKEEPKE